MGWQGDGENRRGDPKDSKMKNIFYTTPLMTTFVKKDLAIFKSAFIVKVFVFEPYPKWKTPFQFLKQFFSILFSIFKIDIFVIQFAGYASFLPIIFGKLFNIPVLIIAAGTESADLKSIKYGDFAHPLIRHFTIFALKNATFIAPVHKSLMGYEYTYSEDDSSQQGAGGVINDFKTPYEEVYYGFDSEKFKNFKKKRQEKSFITIASGFEKEVIYHRKGLDLLFGVAERNLDWTFTIVGSGGESNRSVPSNVNLVRAVPQERLIEMLNEHQFYCQVSRFEGFPNALGEAMLCGCIPIGSDVTGIPTVIGDTGYILKKHGVLEFESLINTAIKNSKKELLSNQARLRIIENFPKSLRKEKLIKITTNLIKNEGRK